MNLIFGMEHIMEILKMLIRILLLIVVILKKMLDLLKQMLEMINVRIGNIFVYILLEECVLRVVIACTITAFHYLKMMLSVMSYMIALVDNGIIKIKTI
jgi:flagellar biosynthesis protein FlhB